MKKTDKVKGFTLIELLITMAMTSVVGAVIVAAYQGQVRSSNTLEIITYMNQTTRAALEIMADEIRMAGCDPLGSANARIIAATPGTLAFSLDIDNDAGENISDGDTCDNNEVVRYRLTNDSDDDGVSDVIASGTACHLERRTGSGLDPLSVCGGGISLTQPLARNIDALNFVYLDRDGDPASNLDEIQTIQVTVVARSGEAEEGFFFSHTDSSAYRDQGGTVILPAQGDGFRRLRLTTTIHVRNTGT